MYGGANDTFRNPVPAFCCSFYEVSFFLLLLFCHLLKVPVLLEKISASYQQDCLMPTSLFCLPAANYNLDQGSFLTGSYEKLCTSTTKAELKLNSNAGLRKGHSGIRSCHSSVSTLGSYFSAYGKYSALSLQNASAKNLFI